MRRLCFVLLALASTAGATEAEAPDTKSALTVGESFTIASDILGEERRYNVFRPEGCAPDGVSAPCPVLYILDGPAHFHYGSGMLVRMAGGGQIPEMIFVAIANTDRTRDLTPTHTTVDYLGDEAEALASSGGGNNFLDFLEQELIPEIENRYDTMQYRILSGHSFGGLLALHALVERPNLFQATIAVDPSLWWHDRELLQRAEKKLAKNTDLRHKVFITIAEHQPRSERSITVMETGSERFAYALDANGSQHLHARIKQYPGEDHGSVAMPSLYDGLLFVFDGYKNPPAKVTTRGLDAVKKYYAGYLAHHDINLPPPSSVLGNMAFDAQQEDDMATALSLLRYNIEIRPKSSFAHYSLAQTYEADDQDELAIKHYRKTLELSPESATFVQPQLDALEAK